MITYSFATIIVLVVILIISMFKILREYERAVVFLLGRFYEVKGPGLIIIVPIVQQMVRVDLRTIVLDVPTQDLITRDNVSVRVNAVVYFRVVEPKMAINNVENYLEATSQLSQTTLRSVLGQHELDELLSARDELNKDLQAILDQHTDNWGIKIANVEIKHVDLDESMVRALARQAEAERSRRAKVIHATGELEASNKLREAATVLNQAPNAVQLRYMQTLTEISNDRTTTIVFPMPIDLVDKFGGLMHPSKTPDSQPEKGQGGSSQKASSDPEHPIDYP
ncbi:slipin family protein [Photobacterium atrarenae]|uniref:Slipin family protein n=1 Tax=Photobacterium atrarenae TaxID=865757 RepID=A0ABY5GL88_9GAMM|nr:slipin family protein [Photobacterium atrarenae]UTV30083.1 slipin family protein [Photobacterium atrarenae]